MTKVTAKYYVFRNKEVGEFLEKYKDRGRLAFENDYTNEIQGALTLSEEGYEQQKKEMKNLAKAFGAEIIEVNATYELTYPNGDEVREIEKDEKKDFDNFLKALLGK
jgi:hypothetical protein|nr:MAG TPA: hypothetical protein [Caudoviricetes sp.]